MPAPTPTTTSDFITRSLSIRCLVDTSSPSLLRTAQFNGEDHIIVPVVALIGDVIVHPMNSEFSELVPAAELQISPSSWDGRPVLPLHPQSGFGSANTPENLQAYSFGHIFNARYSDGKLKMDAWLSLSRAEKVGALAVDVIARCQSGEPVEVSVGARIIAQKQSGSINGQTYDVVWRSINPDHLAMLKAGQPGACSIDMGCGAPRANSAGGDPVNPVNPVNPINSINPINPLSAPRTLVLSTARTPTYKGTSTSSWSKPSLSDYGYGSSVSDLTSAQKTDIAAHSLLGDPSADTFDDLQFFPVVDTSGKLSKNALLAVVGGRGSQANIPDAAKSSAQSKAKSLLKSEFGVDTSDPKANSSMFSRILSSLGVLLKSAAAPTMNTDDDAASLNTLWSALYDALQPVEPGLISVEDIFLSSPTRVVYSVTENSMTYSSCLYERNYTVSDTGSISLVGDRRKMERVYEYQPVAASAQPVTSSPTLSLTPPVADTTCRCHSTPTGATSTPTAGESSTHQETSMDDLTKGIVQRCMSGTATDDDRTKFKAAFGFDAATPAPTSAAVTPVATSATTPPVPTTVAPVVTTPAAPVALAPALTPAPAQSEADFLAQHPDLKSLVDRAKAEEVARRTSLISALSAHPDAKAEFGDSIQTMPTPELERAARLLKLGQPTRNYSGQVSLSMDAPTAEVPAAPEGYTLAIAKLNKQAA